jgi:hypothetical protein
VRCEHISYERDSKLKSNDTQKQYGPPLVPDTGLIARQYRIRRKTDLFFPFINIDDKTAFFFFSLYSSRSCLTNQTEHDRLLSIAALLIQTIIVKTDSCTSIVACWQLWLLLRMTVNTKYPNHVSFLFSEVGASVPSFDWNS